MLASATAGCELEDCTEKAVVLFYVEEALANVTNAYLAFSTVSDTALYSEEDFQERATVFAETLQEVANLNANLTDYFVSRLSSWLAGWLASWLAGWLASFAALWCGPPHFARADTMSGAVFCIGLAAAHHQ